MKAYKGGKTSGGKEPTDPNLLRIIKELGRKEVHVVKNESGHKYSEMLLELIKPYESDRPGVDEIDDLLYVAMNAWNLANLKQELPSAYIVMHDAIVNDPLSSEEINILLEQMITLKEQKFSSDVLYIIEYELMPGKGDQANLTTKAGALEAFLSAVMWGEEEDDEDVYNYEPGYINRSVLIITPREPFLNWVKGMEKGSLPLVVKPEPTIYLVAEKYETKELEKWLKKNFDRLFTKEFADWYTDKKAWPVNRTYKMFREWFDVSFHLEAYDLEDFPVDKELL